MRRDPGRHQFLPSSPDGSGRWAFYRLWRGAGQRLNFVREVGADGTAPAADQPTLYEWLLRHTARVEADGGPPFAALLGDPVAHSRTPAEQRVYFQRYGWPVFLIAVTDADLLAGDALAQLAELGLRAAAVTAPRKHDARRWLQTHGGEFRISDDRDPVNVCNTLGRAKSGRFHGTNTDGIGLRAGWQALVAEDPALATAAVALWGGGGTRELLRSAFPTGVPFSARTAQPRSGEGRPDFDPAVVVWAVGRSRQPGCAWPPASWRPRWVYDLNYSDDSPGREYAARCGARYESGLRFFRAQAVAQRVFWDEILS
jgi:shikimate 5-dehydrogenase